MAQLYDSAKVRSAARSVQMLRYNLEQGAMTSGRRAVRESETLRGMASDAMRENLMQLNQRSSELCEELSSISATLYRYAAALEEVGEELTRQML